MSEHNRRWADSLLRKYFEVLIREDYVDEFGAEFFFELAKLNNCDAHTFIVEALVDFVIGLKQEPTSEELPEEGGSIH